MNNQKKIKIKKIVENTIRFFLIMPILIFCLILYLFLLPFQKLSSGDEDKWK